MRLKAACNTLVTKRFIDEVYEGDTQACIDSPLNDEDDTDPGKPKVGRVSVDGTSADVAVEVVGGKADGTKGTILFAREGGRVRPLHEGPAGVRPRGDGPRQGGPEGRDRRHRHGRAAGGGDGADSNCRGK